jgi:hypothetical protein
MRKFTGEKQLSERGQNKATPIPLDVFAFSMGSISR